jgi:hypothetical protein
MEENGFPVAPAILGIVLGAMLEENFISSMIKADGRFPRSSNARSPARLASSRSRVDFPLLLRAWRIRRPETARS